MMPAVCSKDIRSPDAEKMTDIQTSTGNQYQRRNRNLGTRHGNRKICFCSILKVAVQVWIRVIKIAEGTAALHFARHINQTCHRGAV